MSRFSPLKKVALTIAAAVVAAGGMVALSPGAAHAASLFTVRLAPTSNLFLFVEVRGASTASTAPIDQWSYTGGKNQVWTFMPTGGYYEIINQNSGKCIMTDGTPGHQLIQAPCTGSRYQLWQVANEWVKGDFTYDSAIRNPASGLYMDVYGGSTTQGAAIDAWYNNGASANQFFRAYPL
jgi:Ricin-type beta-trefoil lectin domain-like